MAGEFGHASVGTSLSQTEFEGTTLHRFNGAAAGDIGYDNGTSFVRLAKGTARQILAMNAGATAPEWSSNIYPAIIYGFGTYLRIGDAATTSHVFASEDDLMVTGKLEVNGICYLDGQIVAGDIAVVGYRHNVFGGDFTSDGSANTAVKNFFSERITGASGDTAYIAETMFSNVVTTQTASETIGSIAQVRINEPNITDNLTGGGLITVAATVHIVSAPTEGVTNAALYIENGDMKYAGSVDSAAIADQVALGGYEIGAGNRVIAISQETAVAAEVDETKFSHKMQVRLNGATYFMMLTQT